MREADTRAGRLDRIRAAVREWKSGNISAPEAIARAARIVDVTLAEPDDAEAADVYYIQNAGRPVGNCVRWWRHNGHGYTSDLNEAWIVTKDQADMICRSRPDEDVPRRAAEMEAIAQRHVDIQGLR